MITNEAQYRHTLNAIELIRESIAHLKAEMATKSERWFAIMAAGPLEDLARLQDEVDEYLGIARAEELQAEIWMQIEGRDISWPQAATSVLTDFLENLRTGVQQIAEFLSRGGQLSTRPTTEIKAACDFQVMALAHGSLRVGLNLPTLSLANAELPARDPSAVRALDDFLDLARLLKDGETEIEGRFVDVSYRRVVLNAVKSLAPRPRGSVESVGLSGWRVGGSRVITLTRDSRVRIDNAIKKTSHEPPIVATGQVREIDLDQPSLTLRHPKKPDCRCNIPDELLEIAKTSLDRWVTVTGTEKKRSVRTTGAITIDVVTFDVLEEAPEDARALGDK